MKEENPQRRLQTVLYVRRNETEPPFPVVVNVEAFTENKQGGAEVLEAVPPPRRAEPPMDMFAGWASSQSFPCELRVYSWVLILASFGVLTASFIIFLQIASDRLWYDEFDTKVSEIGCYALCVLFLAIVILRLVQSCLVGQDATPGERISASLSLVSPGLKYHMARLNANFKGIITNNYRFDLICECLQLAVGIAAVVASQYAYEVTQNGAIKVLVEDKIFITLGILLLVETVILFPLTMLLHSRWLSGRLHAERDGHQLRAGLMNYNYGYVEQPRVAQRSRGAQQEPQPQEEEPLRT